MNRHVAWIAFTAGLCFGAPARADYLSDVIRDTCLAKESAYYSAADPVVGTVPLVESEVGRISSNYMVYGGFKYHGEDDFRGHLYAIRLFEEKTAHENDWEFTDTGSATLLTTCGEAKSACLFDAGAMLDARVKAGKRRKIYTGRPGTRLDVGASDGAFTLPITAAVELTNNTAGVSELADVWQRYVALDPISSAMPKYRQMTIPVGNKTETVWRWDCPGVVPASLCKPDAAEAEPPGLRKPSDDQLLKMIQWLHGKHRNWPLGDIYHASAAVVEPPGFGYKDRGYPEFKEKLAGRPSMIYVGANDGMIHAFYASPDLEKIKKKEDVRWKPGDEAWAYLPVNMLARTIAATEGNKQRFFSQDLSCRFSDVLVDTSFTTCTTADQARDPYCGWRTLLLCGQGVGGSWYVTLDVTDPLAGNGFKPHWEFTHTGSVSNNYGIGRTWSLPSISLTARNRTPVWLAIFGNGFNSSMTAYDGITTKAYYRNLNMPFDGDFPNEGQGTKTDLGHAYVLDIADGKLLADLHDTEAAPNPFVADSTVLDYDWDGLADVAYLAAYPGMNRVDLSSKNYSMCNLAGLDLGGQAVITGHPTAFSYRSDSGPYKVVLVAGSGIDSGSGPDEQANNGNNWGVLSKIYMEKDGAKCPQPVDFCELAFGFNDGSRKARLLGAPLFTRRARTGDNTQPYDDLLLYSIWTAPHHNEKKECDKMENGHGTAHLLCMDVTLIGDNQKPRCKLCDGYSTESNDTTLLYSNETQAPSAPVSVDGRVYVNDPTRGFTVVDLTHDDIPPNANSGRPTAAIPATLLSWREVYSN